MFAIHTCAIITTVFSDVLSEKDLQKRNLYFVFCHLREIQAAMFRFVILTCFLTGGKFDNYLHNATVMSIYIIYKHSYLETIDYKDLLTSARYCNCKVVLYFEQYILLAIRTHIVYVCYTYLCNNHNSFFWCFIRMFVSLKVYLMLIQGHFSCIYDFFQLN
jgi:hypothetical protein